MRLGRATGLQIAFLLLAVLLLSVPASRAIIHANGTPADWRPIVERGTQFVVGALLILAIPALRRAAALELSRPIPKAMRLEVVAVGVAKTSLAFASFAVLGLWLWASEGSPGLVDRMVSDPGTAYARAVSPQGLVRHLLLASLLAPIVEELVCRAFLYRAFERQYGWFAAMLASSAVFGLFHPHFGAAFASGIVFVCLLRRTGSLWAPISVHAFTNFMLWEPMLGQYVVPRIGPDDLRTWTFHVFCLAFVAIALPAYVWMSRDRAVVAATAYLEPDGALQK
jgi:membrane protease YdiL (CAAX protease family)